MFLFDITTNAISSEIGDMRRQIDFVAFGDKKFLCFYSMLSVITFKKRRVK